MPQQYEIVLAGGAAIVVDAVDFGLKAQGGKVIMSSGGTTIDASVLSGGVEVVSSGGVADDTVVHAGGVERVKANAFDSGTTISSAAP